MMTPTAAAPDSNEIIGLAKANYFPLNFPVQARDDRRAVFHRSE